MQSTKKGMWFVREGAIVPAPKPEPNEKSGGGVVKQIADKVFVD